MIIRWPTWNRFLIPTLLMAGMWLICSSATTLGILWLERGYQSMLNENVTTIESVGEMHHALLNLQDCVFDDVASRAQGDMSNTVPNYDSAESTKDFWEALEKADRSALTDPEKVLVRDIRSTFSDYLADLRSPVKDDPDLIPGKHPIELAARVSALSDRLLEINQQLIDDHTLFYDAWSQRIRWMGMTLTVLGPLLGSLLGIRAASHLKQRMMRLRVSLAGVSGEPGAIEVAPETSWDAFGDLDQQASAAAARIADVLKELDAARGEAQRNERLAVVGQLAAGVAHELRNPLTSVKLLVQTAMQQSGARENLQAALADDESEPVRVVQAEIERMERTIQSLLDFARPTVPQSLRHDLRTSVQRALNLIQPRAERDGVTITTGLSPHVTPITADPDLLQQVFVNLLLNALDAVQVTGDKRIEVSFEEKSDERHDFSNGCVWRILIRDHGAGIPAEVSGKIFEPFMTTKSRGTGLGLAVSRRIVEEHHGHLTARNHAEGGAIFAVELPPASD